MMELILIIKGVSAIVGGASMLATITPTKKDDKILGYASKVIHFLAFNFGHAKNAN